jgi:large subunit ribosomal protein L3
MKFILGKKLNMTQIFDDSGKVTPVTVVQAGPLVVTQVKTEAHDGVNAVQVGYGDGRLKNRSKAEVGHLKLDRAGRGSTDLREFNLGEVAASQQVGETITVDTFAEGDEVVVSGVSKGKGFQGVVKRYGFGGGRRSHGQKHSEREPGSIGATAPQRVFKGVRMAGRMGSDRVSVKSLKVIKVDQENNLLFVQGAVPGRRGTLLEIVAK